LYRIDSRYDGFTPKEISNRAQKGYLTYNWNQYFDEVTRGDIVFTYFIGSSQPRGIYLIAKAVKFPNRNEVKAKVLDSVRDEPIVAQEKIAEYLPLIINRPRGSVFTIPPFLDGIFDRILHDRVSSDIEISEDIDCHSCFDKKTFPCDKCSIFDRDYVINWEKEVALKIPCYERVVSPFWIIPYQSHWTKTSIKNHIISRIFYSFKAGYTYYSRLFARGIKKAINDDPVMRIVKFDYILGVPLSPEKIHHGEKDRVALVCTRLGKLMGVEYLPALSLSEHISRREYRHSHTKTEFINDYSKRLRVCTAKSLQNKRILIIDDVITGGTTLQTICQKIKEIYPDCELFAATCGIFAKKPNVLPEIVKKFQR
jgi:predicted amidophosphoribosyltransferase